MHQLKKKPTTLAISLLIFEVKLFAAFIWLKLNIALFQKTKPIASG
jgi:hypothetical protein